MRTTTKPEDSCLRVPEQRKRPTRNAEDAGRPKDWWCVPVPESRKRPESSGD
jgi:hypothetical protein